MQPKTPKLLEDIRDAAAFIRDSVRGKTIDDYHADRLLRQAVERNFEIIGEAIKRLSQHDPEIVARIGDHRQIIAFRNVLIHGYDLVDHALVWSTILERAQNDARFREALSTEAINAYLAGDTGAGKAILRDLTNATIGFEDLAAEFNKPSKSLHRMLAPQGNPGTENFFDIVSVLQKTTRVKLRVISKAA